MCVPAGRALNWTKCGHSQDEWPEKTQKANLIIIKSVTVSHMAEQFFWVLLPCCPLPGCPSPVKPFALSVHLPSWIIHFWVLDKTPLSGSGRGFKWVCTHAYPMSYIFLGLYLYHPMFTITLMILEPSHFTDDRTETQRGDTDFRRSQGQWVVTQAF